MTISGPSLDAVVASAAVVSRITASHERKDVAMPHPLRISIAGGLALSGAFLTVAAASFPVAAQTAGGGAAPKVHRAEIAPGLYEIAYSPRQRAVFVASTGGGDVPPRILKLDPATLEVKQAIPLERRGFGLTLDDAADRLYIGHALDGAVSVLNTATGQVSATVPLVEKTRSESGREGYRHHFRELVVDRTSHRLFMPGLDMEDSALFVVNTRDLKLEKTIPGLGFVATGLALDEAGGKVYVSNLQGQVFVFDTRTLALVHTWNIGVDQPLNLAFDGARARLFATDQGIPQIDDMRKKSVPDFTSAGPGNRVAIVDAKTGKVTASLPAGRGPIAPLLDGGRNRLFVTNREDGTVMVFDAASHRALHTIPLADHPNSLAIDQEKGVVYVTIKSKQGTAPGTPESVARIELP